MKKVFLISLLFSIITISAVAQDTYVRPSISIINVDFNNNRSTLDLNSIKIPANLDEVKLSNKSFSVNANSPKILMRKEMETATASEVWGGESLEVIEDRNDKVINSFMSKRISNDAVMAVTPVKKNGEYNYEYVMARGVNSATDQDVNITSQTMSGELMSKEDRFVYIAEQMLDANYVIAYNMGDFRSWSDEKDIGFENAISYWIIKVASYYSAEGEIIKANQLPTTRVNAEVLFSGTVGPLSTANRRGAKYPSTDAELQKTLLDFLLPQVWHSALMNVDGLQPKATLLKRKKIALGKKENLKIGSRFFAFENVENKDGEVIKKKRSMLRVKKVGDNRGLATGNSERSKLYRIGPGSAKEGMLVQQKENLGLSLSVGGGALAHIRADYRIKAVTPGFLVFWDWNVYPGKVKFDIDEYQKQGLAGVLTDTAVYGDTFKDFGSGDFSTSGMNMAFGMEKQIHLHPLVYVSPAAGLGFSTLSLEGNLMEGTSEIDTSSNIIFASIFLEFGARVGVQLSGNLSLNLSIMATTGGSWYDFALNSGDYNYGVSSEEEDQEVLEEYYERVLKKVPGIMNGGIKTNIMLRYEF